jgi:hypothetical protein
VRRFSASTVSPLSGIGWIPFYLDRSDRHYTNQKSLRRDFGDTLRSDVFREHSLACYVTDKASLKLRHEIGIDIIAWECDYPHSDCFWPDAPEQVLAELDAAGADDSDIKITWENSCRFFGWDPFARTPKEQANVGALRVKGPTSTSRSGHARSGRGATPKSKSPRPKSCHLTDEDLHRHRRAVQDRKPRCFSGILVRMLIGSW